MKSREEMDDTAKWNRVGPEQHAATGIDRLATTLRKKALYRSFKDKDEFDAALDELVALAGRADKWPEELHAQYLAVLDERDAAEARADELQRELDELLDERWRYVQAVKDAEEGAGQARREAEQLRAALRTASGLIWEGRVGNAQAVIDAALAALRDLVAQADRAAELEQELAEQVAVTDSMAGTLQTALRTAEKAEARVAELEVALRKNEQTLGLARNLIETHDLRSTRHHCPAGRALITTEELEVLRAALASPEASRFTEGEAGDGGGA